MTGEGLILVVDDQVEHLKAIEMLLQGGGYQVMVCVTAATALRILENEPIDLIIADVAMPGMNGYQLFEAIQQQPEWAGLPFIFLTARALDSDIRYGKALGVDDYLTKPINPEDLLAVVEGKLRRKGKPVRSPGQAIVSRESGLRAGGLHIDAERHRVWLEGQPLNLSVREFALLEDLVRHAGTIVPARDLVRVTHGLQTEDAEEARELIRPLIRTLRRKLGDGAGETGAIETVRGLGYRLVETDGL